MQSSHSNSYRAAGVDLNAGYQAVQRMASHVQRTHRPEVLGDLGGFGGMFAPNLAGLAQPVLVSGTDGVGTKLQLAFLMDKHDTVGIDCVAMCVNDIVCAGAEPLFFLDYIACGKNQPARIEAIVAGVAEGCVQAGCALVGGETAEMPGFYAPEEYDLAGFAVGLADREKMPEAAQVQPGDVVLALPSSGPHSNGFSLIRQVFGLKGPAADAREKLAACPPELGGASLGQVLLTPTRIYAKAMLALARALPLHGAAHITGGGFYENIPRCLPAGLAAAIETSALQTPPIFQLIAEAGGISRRDMFNTFNMGVGMVAIVPASCEAEALALLRGQGVAAYPLGEIVTGDTEVQLN